MRGSLLNMPGRLAQYGRHLWRDVRPAARRRSVSPFRILREQFVLRRRNLLPPSDYFLYGLDDPAMPWEEKLAYIGGELHRRHWDILTPPKYQHLFKNKLVFKRLFGSMGFPVAKLYGVYDPDWGRSEDGAPLRSADDLADWMRASDVADPVFKAVESAEGRMVFVMRGRADGDRLAFIGVSGEEYSPERLVGMFSDPALLREAYPPYEYHVPPRSILIEQRLRQHEALAVLAPKTLCCARIVTVTTLDGRVEVVETAMKLQGDGSGVDNVIQGSVAIGVDPESGVLKRGWCKDDPPGTFRTCVPGTDAEFAGIRLPMWRDVMDLARRAAAAFPLARSVGWDVAFTPDGPYLVEGNAAWGNFQRECEEGLLKGAYKQTIRALSNGVSKR